MSQGSLVIQNTGTLSGLALVNAVNAAIDRLVTESSGTTDPSSLTGGVQPYSFWMDTSVTPNILRQRNSANTAWVIVGTVNGGASDAQTQQFTAFTTSGSATAYTLTPSPAITALATNQRFTATFHASNTSTTPTLAISGLTAKNLKVYDSTGAKQNPAVGAIAINMISDVLYDGTDYVVLDQLPVSTASNAQIQTLPITVASNALTLAGTALALDFRSTTSTSGTITRVSGTPANLVAPNGATLGIASGTIGRIAVLAMNNSGTIEYAFVNVAGGLQLDESNLISTTAISASATSASVIYSTTARSNLAYRVIGFFDGNGTWSAQPNIQGAGGNSLASLSAVTINNAGASSDIGLAIGEQIYIDFSAATSVPLHVVTGDNQLYELTIMAAGNTGSTGFVYLNPNNTTYTNFFRVDTTTQTSNATSNQNAFVIVYGADPRYAYARISTKTISKFVKSDSSGFTGATTYLSTSYSMWNASASTTAPTDTTTLWTSLGTLTFPVAATGRVYVKRIA